ncbi:MAG: hypothetical protein K2P81_05305 [Bacteriovoracaceae bacterium]|nr:hypothetical protein [Bacteriovoracaceae bacterium]
MNRPLVRLALLACLSTSAAWAQTDPLKQIYPFKPYDLQDIQTKVSRLTEDAKPLMNVIEMDRQKLLEASSKVQPWGGYYWQLNQGQIANNWQDKSFLSFWQYLGWEGNVKNWKKRRVEMLPNVMDLSEEEIAKLAPSEKYDLLVGDKTFDLTNRVWDFAERWGNSKKWGFLSSIQIPEGYRVPKANSLMALWEGICHGWALAAGAYPRAEHTVTFTLPNGKKMPFYPDDIKALVSLMFANSIVQDNVIVEGIRCNDKNPKRDEFGRFIDEMPKKEGEAVLPRCADVHPAVWHAAVVNLTGLQGRSFVAEIDANATINNHPFKGYKFEWFNPKSGRTDELSKSMIDLKDYKDPYKESRNPNAVKLVGVDMKMFVVDWTLPKDKVDNTPDDDKIKDKSFMYDLELDAQGNIVGGQWRATRTAESFADSNSSNDRPPTIDQPDFFWVIPKNFMIHFQDLKLEAWDGKGVVPKSWMAPAKNAHAFIYNVTREYGFDEKCTVIPEKGKGAKEVPCEFKYPRPQPLVNIVNQLLKLSH